MQGYGFYGPPPGVPVPGWGFPGYLPSSPLPLRIRHTLARRDWLWAVVVTAVVAVLIGGIAGAVVALRTQRTVVEQFFPNEAVLAKPGDVQAILAQVEPAVVSVDATGVAAHAGSGGGSTMGAGTGMIITSSGEVLTNNHVVAGASRVTVTLFGQTEALPAQVLGTDPAKDLALLEIANQHDLPTVVLGDSNDTRVGDDVLAIGNALALQGGLSVTEGIVSATGRSVTAQNEVTNATEHLTGLFQTDAAINPGNSGGPLVNSHAQVIAMNTAVAESSGGNAPAQNIGFAIPVDAIEPELGVLAQGGTH